MIRDDVEKLADLLLNLMIDLANANVISAARYEDESAWLTTLTGNFKSQPKAQGEK